MKWAMLKFVPGVIALTLLGGCGQTGPSSKPDMMNAATQVRGAAELKVGQVLVSGKEALWGDVSLTKVPYDKKCNPPRPTSGAKVVNVTAHTGRKSARPLGWLDQSEAYSSGRSVQMSTIVEVLVTETQHPVYLALASQDEVLWVIRKTPGAKVDGVTMIGFKPPAIIGGPGTDRTGFLLARGNFIERKKSHEMVYVTAKDVNAARRAEAAHKRSYMQPQKYFSAAEQAKVQPANFERTKEDFAAYKVKEKEYKAWRTWLRKKLGRVDDDVSGYGVRVAVVGPPPSQPIVRETLSGEILIVDGVGEPFLGSREEAMAVLRARAEGGS